MTYSDGTDLLTAPPQTIERIISGRAYRICYWSNDVRASYFSYRGREGSTPEMCDARLVQVLLVDPSGKSLFAQTDAVTVQLATGNRPLIQLVATECVKHIKQHEPSVEDVAKNSAPTPSGSGSAE